MIRAQLAEFGIALAKGIQHALRDVQQLVAGPVPNIPALAITVVVILAAQLGDLQVRIGALEKELKTWTRDNAVVKRLQTIPGVGILTASALAASVTDPHQFTSGRQFAAWLGLIPRVVNKDPFDRSIFAAG